MKQKPMKKKIISLMCQNIKQSGIDIDQFAINNPDQAIRYLHNQYAIAEIMHQKKSVSQRRI